MSVDAAEGEDLGRKIAGRYEVKAGRIEIVTAHGEVLPIVGFDLVQVEVATKHTRGYDAVLRIEVPA
jgi:hypothetical protein